MVIVSSFSRINPADPDTSTLVLAVTVVNAPDEADVAPIAVPSTLPPFISTVVIVAEVIVVEPIVPPLILSPDIWSLAKVRVPLDTSNVFPVPTVILEVAIVVPSIVPASMSTASRYAVPSI